MGKPLVICSILGLLLGAFISLLDVDDSLNGLLISIVACIAAGYITVYTVRDYPNLYSLVTVSTTVPLLLISYGISDGLAYTLGVAFIYGICSVQLFLALRNSFHNAKVIFKSFKPRKR
ncbi:hypothetical protein L5M16_23155 [Shewanella sp. SM103]|jgi:hypothetical protein|uniref:hypothetical protein n=1 Tax=Shewanella sp. SM103 TaxID=2912791 RepID=UPI0021DA6DD8|nr:hypothetical protein [Shewanella sp. SM103]MCU8024415.1 hypothetical protein [Shewanella sp. SM78]MCU8081406.1 hypothetical protein [Shewanella sp. SM103]